MSRDKLVRPWRLESPSGMAFNTFKYLDGLLGQVKKHPSWYLGYVARNRETGEIIDADEIARRVSA